jgi:hypothetical protein
MGSRKPRMVPLDADMIARFHAELPVVIALREQRVLRAQRTWGWEALGYVAVTLAGVTFWGWSPVLVLLHLMLMQWISLVAEVVVLFRLQRAGVGRLLPAGNVNRFVETVIAVRELAARPGARGVPMIQDDCLLEGEPDPADSSRSSPGGLAVVLLLFGGIATGLMLAGLAFAPRELHDTLRGQVVALAWLGVAAAVRFFTQYRAITAPLLPGARWNVEFSPGLRLMSTVMLGLLSLPMFQSLRSATESIQVLLACIGFWAGVTLVFLPMFRRNTERMRAILAAGPCA